MKKLEKLTPQQIARLPEIRDEWLRIGLSCDPCDIERAKVSVSDAYREAGLEPPQLSQGGERWLIA